MAQPKGSGPEQGSAGHPDQPTVPMRSIPEGPPETARPALAPALLGQGVASGTDWFIEQVVGDGQRRRLPLHPLPFRIGRRHDLELHIPSPTVSKLHAEIVVEQDVLRVRDMGSTNGTFVDGQRVTEGELGAGAILHVSSFEFRVGRLGEEADEDLPRTLSLGGAALPRNFALALTDMRDLLAEGLLEPVFQPIVLLPNGRVAAYEALARGRHPGLPESPLELFQVAESMGVEAELSRLCRRVAVERVKDRSDFPPLFLNTHPAELKGSKLVESLVEIRKLAPRLSLVLEIHESVLADTQSLGVLRERLAELGVGLAYDDFGAGQARLLELAEVPPDYLKFDLRFVRNIDTAPPSKRRLLESLVLAASDLRVQPIAEGVETSAEAEVCAGLGFTHAQGYLFRGPVPTSEL